MYLILLQYLMPCLAPPPPPPEPELPTDDEGNTVERISGNSIELAFTQPTNVNGELRYINLLVCCIEHE